VDVPDSHIIFYQPEVTPLSSVTRFPSLNHSINTDDGSTSTLAEPKELVESAQQPSASIWAAFLGRAIISKAQRNYLLKYWSTREYKPQATLLNRQADQP
jgi:hypothetical protein